MDKEVIMMYKNGKTMREIANKYGCERHRISRILKKNNVSTSKRKFLKGKKFKNKENDEYIVIEDILENGKTKCKIKFLNTGYESIHDMGNVKKGTVKDYYKRTIYGLACKGKIICPKGSYESLCFHRWQALISRCYNTKDINYKNYGGRGVKVCEKWLVFENFYHDLPKLKGYDKEKYMKHEIELDKDFGKNKFSKEYSPKNCQFLSVADNRKYQRRNIRPFKAISPEGKEYIFETQIDCARKLNLTARTIGKCLNKQLKHHHNYSFEYLEPQTTIPNGSSE